MRRAIVAISAGTVAVSIGVVSAMPASAGGLAQAKLSPKTFVCTKAEQTYSVPAGVGALKIEAIGASGSASVDTPRGLGGPGAVVHAWVRLPKGSKKVYVEVGCPGSGNLGGFNGGGTTGKGGGGGGASDVRLDPMSTALSTKDTRLVVAGGGGGGAPCNVAGGSAGDTTVTGPGAGGSGHDVCPGATPGGSGGLRGTAGGSGGAGTTKYPFTGGAGSRGQGGSTNLTGDKDNYGGGGGGGYFGGGAGGDGENAGGGGGAGSSFWISSATHKSMSPNGAQRPAGVVITPACLVPKLKGKSLHAAKRALMHSHCKLGKVTKKTSSRKAGTVISQKPKPETIRTIGSRVRLVVSG